VLVEAGVLDGHDGVAHVLGDVEDRDEGAVLLGVQRGEDRPVGRVDDRGLGERDLRRLVVGEVGQPARRGREGHEDEQQRQGGAREAST
jgi:hypothetical protein